MQSGGEFSSDALDALEGVCYVTKLNGEISAVGRSNWDAFALDNAAPTFTAESVIGKNLFEFIAGKELQQAYRLFVTVVTGKAERIDFNFHCDAPALRREMRLCMCPVKKRGKVSGILYQSTLVAAAARPSIELFEPQRITGTGPAMAGAETLLMCSYCQKVRRSSAEDPAPWLTPEEHYRLGGTSNVRIEHRVCGDCHARIVAPLMRD